MCRLTLVTNRSMIATLFKTARQAFQDTLICVKEMVHNNHQTANNNAMYTMHNSLMFWTYTLTDITRINEKLLVLIFLPEILV